MIEISIDPTVIPRSSPEVLIRTLTPDEVSLEFHSRGGTGLATAYSFGEVSLNLFSGCNHDDIRTTEKVPRQHVTIDFLLQGKVTKYFDEPLENVEYVAGKSVVAVNHHDARFLIPKNTPYSSVSIGIPPDYLFSLIENAAHSPAVRLLSRTLRDQSRNVSVDRSDINPRTNLVLTEIVHAPYSGVLRSTYLHGKALELLAVRIDQMLHRNGFTDTNRVPELRKSDVEKIHRAKDIIVSCFENPPTIRELSRMVGLNDFKLKKYFKKIHGKTIFGLLREHRLYQAMALLEEGEMNVTEVAMEVGYSNIGHFSSAFHRVFGTYPSLVRRNRR